MGRFWWSRLQLDVRRYVISVWWLVSSRPVSTGHWKALSGKKPHSGYVIHTGDVWFSSLHFITLLDELRTTYSYMRMLSYEEKGNYIHIVSFFLIGLEERFGLVVSSLQWYDSLVDSVHRYFTSGNWIIFKTFSSISILRLILYLSLIIRPVNVYVMKFAMWTCTLWNSPCERVRYVIRPVNVYVM